VSGRFSFYDADMAKNIAVLLCGSGRSDGSEITEAVSTLIHLSRLGATYSCFSPDMPQTEVVNHATGKPQPGGTRNMMAESARISRGAIAPIGKLDAGAFDGLIVPGGFGVAKNLCDFASKGTECAVLPDAEAVLRAFHTLKKPIGLICIAPMLAARIFGTRANGPGCRLTLGGPSPAADAAATLGNTAIAKGVTEVMFDDKNRVYSTPAYMYDNATPHQVFEGIGRMVELMLK